MKPNLFLSLLTGIFFLFSCDSNDDNGKDPGPDPDPTYPKSELAFPGAEGFGKNATGGRGGKIYHVTNLNDAGRGSFRDAVSQPNRIVIFDVSGVIKIGSRISVAPNITILGQSAPGDGVVIYGNGLSFSGANNTIVRFMRFRMGSRGDDGKDAMAIAYGENMIFDHVSVSWGLDENFSINWDTSKSPEPTNITFQNSICSHGLMGHSMGGLMQTTGGITIYRCLYINNKSRNPKVKGLNQFVNNVVYNWSSSDGYILGDSEGPSWATIEDSYFIRGPKSSGGPFTRANQNFQVYHSGNLLDLDKDGELNGIAAMDSHYGNAKFVYDKNEFDGIPKLHPQIENHMKAYEALEWIVKYAGASLPARDEVDKYVMEDLLSYGKKGTLIYDESELGLENNVGAINPGELPADSDGDGIPDAWEIANGLDPDDFSDAAKIGPDGYANIERYLNSLVKYE